MKKVLKTVTYVALCALLSGRVWATEPSDFDMWKEDFKNLALQDGISQQTLDIYLPQMMQLEHVVQQDRKMPENLQNFWDYTQARLNETKVNKARLMQRTYPTWLNRVSEQYQVQPEYLLALWGMETNFGSFMGKTRLLNSLASLAFDKRRRKFFTKELLAYFHILESEPYPPQWGSWDGGFGNFQFMPTTFMAYAVDADHNGSKSLIGSIPDSFASAANFLHKMGWHGNEIWGHEVNLPDEFDWGDVGQEKTVIEWIKIGITPKDWDIIPESESTIMAKLRAPFGSSGPAFLTYHNFNLIHRWNGLELYALTTGIFTDMIQGKRSAPVMPSDFRPLRTHDFCQLQEKLRDMGYYHGEVDGKLGPNMRQALKSYQKDNHLLQDGYPNKDVLVKTNIYKKELK